MPFLRSFLSVGIVTISCLAAQAADPVAWFKADGITGVADGGNVGIWADASGSGNTALSTLRPTLVANQINGLPVVRFNGAQTQSLSFKRPIQDDFGIVVVFRSTQGSGSGGDPFYNVSALVSGEQGGVVNDFGMGFSQSGRVVAGIGNPDTTIRTSSGKNDGNFHIATFTRTKSSGGFSIFVDNSATASEETPATGNTNSLDAPIDLTIGAHPTLVNYYTGDIAEVILYNNNLSSDRNAIERALQGKYAIGTLANRAAPITPTGLVASGARIKWKESVGAASYDIARSTTEGGTYTTIGTGIKNGVFVDTTVVNGGTYYYKVRAVNGVGASALSAPVASTLPTLPENGKVLINEIHYNGTSNAVHSDFIELYNYSSSPANIGGWRISSAIDYIFPSGTTIPAGGYLVIAEDPTTVQALWGETALGPYDGSLSSDGETIRLRDAGDNVVTEVTYSSGFPWPCAANGNGASAELINPDLDPRLGSSWRSSITDPTGGEVASPGTQNFQYTGNPPPNIENVSNLPAKPSASTPIIVTAKVTDSTGVASVKLAYQIVAPGSYIPAYLPIPIVGGNIDTTQARPANPAFENPANWTTVTMHDDGANGDAVAGDGIYSGTIPGQAHRTLVRYRITATDSLGSSVRAPFLDDQSKNFATFVYNGVPAYQGVPAATLEKLPTYHFLTRKTDYDQCVAYDPSYRLNGGTPGWNFENWEAAIVFEGKVYDHILYRLHGGNGRYYFSGKRAFRFFFNEGYDFQNRDNDGNLYPVKWNSLTTENCWENRSTLTYSLNEAINFYLWNMVGVPATNGNWGHFRLITTAQEQPDAWHGDFWGLIFIHEDIDRRFIDSHSLEKGNLYKLSRDSNDGPTQQRYQAPDSVTDASDYNNIQQLNGAPTSEFISKYVNTDRWSYYHAIAQAVRHYDYWPTGDNNAAYYFAPDESDPTNLYGKLWILPNDVDATWGPTWNDGKDIVYEAIFDEHPEFYPQYFNAVREVRDLVWQQDQINPLLDQFAATIAPFIAADSARWKNAPADAGNYDGLTGPGATSLAALVQDMKNFAWVGGSWPGGDVGAGGRAAFLDTLQASQGEGAKIPATPALTYTGASTHPVNGLKFQTSAYSDPQGAGTFGAIQWRVAEVTDATAPAYNAAAKVFMEWNATYDTGALTTFGNELTFPSFACQVGHAYRARVRHMDNTGRWSHWSQPIQFVAGQAEANPDDQSLVVSEFLYKPTSPTASEISAGFTDANDFEFIELQNVGSQTINLSGLKFTTGITFTFPNGTTIAPNAYILVVKNVTAFNLRFGSGKPIAGAYSGNLNNSGEQVVLAKADNTPLIDFTYSDDAPWPTEPDTANYSLVLKDPGSKPNLSDAASWRISRLPNGSPGAADIITYDQWSAAYPGIGSSTDDPDGDSRSNFAEYTAGTSPTVGNIPQLATSALQTLTVGGTPGQYLTVTYRKQTAAPDLNYIVEFSPNASSWSASGVQVSSTLNGDGTTTEIWRSPVAVDSQSAYFGRLRVTQ
jgi:hypothetical protein